MLEVIAQRPLEVDWKFISLRFVNRDRDYDEEFPPGYPEIHGLGLSLLRVAAAVRESAGREAMQPLYSAFGTVIHDQRRRPDMLEAANVRKVLADLGHPEPLAAAADSTDFDAIIDAETTEALERCGGFILDLSGSFTWVGTQVGRMDGDLGRLPVTLGYGAYPDPGHTGEDCVTKPARHFGTIGQGTLGYATPV